MRILPIVLVAVFFCSCTEKENSISDSTQEMRNVASDLAAAQKQSNNANPVINKFHISDEAKGALLDLYGGIQLNDKRLVEYINVETAYVIPVFEKHFISEGSEKLLVLGVLSETDGAIQDCHACTPLLGGAVFSKQGQKWVVENEQKIIGWGGPFGTLGDIDIVLTGKNKYGVAIRVSDMHQGYENMFVRVFVPYNGKLVEALGDGFAESPSENACENINIQPQSFDVKFEPANDADYFDLVTRSQFNEGDCEHFVRKDITIRYRFNNGKYLPV